MTRLYRLTLQYAGTRFAGWQVQPGLETVQGTVEAALGRLLGAAPRVHGAGRTDAGVHARAQSAHFETDRELEPARALSALNHFLPWDVRALALAPAPPGFHARSSAVSKEYRYRIHRGETIPPEKHPYALLVRGPLDVAALARSASVLAGRRDFAAFRVLGSTAETTVRTVHLSEWTEEGAELTYRIAADGFLYKMVRTIVGTLLEAGRGRRSVDQVAGLIAPDRGTRAGDGSRHGPDLRAGPVAPAKGLHLWQVDYPPEVGA